MSNKYRRRSKASVRRLRTRPNERSEVRPLVRVQLSPPLGSPCRSRASTFFALRHHRRGFSFFKVHLGDVNSSGHHSVHTVVWLSCRKIGVALLVESGKKASPKRCSGDALNLNYFRFSCSSRDRQTGRCHSAVTIIYA